MRARRESVLDVGGMSNASSKPPLQSTVNAAPHRADSESASPATVKPAPEWSAADQHQFNSGASSPGQPGKAQCASTLARTRARAVRRNDPPLDEPSSKSPKRPSSDKNGQCCHPDQARRWLRSEPRPTQREQRDNDGEEHSGWPAQPGDGTADVARQQKSEYVARAARCPVELTVAGVFCVRLW